VEPQERFRALVQEFAGHPGVTVPSESGRREFGSSALKVHGSIFAMLTGGGLVVKLPADRVRSLIEAGPGAPFDGGKGTPMKEWLTVTSADDETWSTLAAEALEFVASRRRR
jgi:hypothetical protein